MYPKIRWSEVPLPLILLLIFCYAFNPELMAQDSLWTLERCKQYAKQNNLNIQKSILDERLAKMQLQQSKLVSLPSLSFSVNYGANFGRSIEPTTNEFITTSYDFNGLSGSSNMLLFGWFQKRHQMAKAKLDYQAASNRSNQVSDDIVLNITVAYFRVLLAADQREISLKQIELGLAQLSHTNRLFSGGKSNGLDLAQVKTQLAIDSATYFKSQLAYQQAILEIKVILDLNFDDPFIPAPLSMDRLTEAIPIFNSEDIFNGAVYNSAALKSNNYLIKSSQKKLAIAKAALYPQLNLGVSAGTNYSSTFREYRPNGEYQQVPWGRQIRNNFNQSVYLGLSIPIFSNLQARYSIRQAKIEIEKAEILAKEAKVKLKQDVYRAVNEVNYSIVNLRTAKSTAQTAKTGFDFAQKRYDKGLISAFEVLQTKTTLFRAELDEVSAKYDLLFKLIVIDYYNGNGR